jgi:hypothetical protein
MKQSCYARVAMTADDIHHCQGLARVLEADLWWAAMKQMAVTNG